VPPRDSQAEPYVGAAESLAVAGYEALTEIVPSVIVVLSPLLDSAGSGIGALTSPFQDVWGVTSLGELNSVKGVTMTGSVRVVVRTSVKGATASGDTSGLRRRRRMHRKMTSRTKRTIKAPRTPPTMAAMGGPLWIAAAG